MAYSPADNPGGLTQEQYDQWKRGELVIEFVYDTIPEVNHQDFEKWVQERNLKAMTKQVPSELADPEISDAVYSSHEVSPLSGHCIK
jgi:hypothetical protein